MERKFYENEGRIIIGSSLNPATLCAEHAVVPQRCRQSSPTWRTVIGDPRQAFLGMHEATPLPSQEGASLSLGPKLAMSCRWCSVSCASGDMVIALCGGSMHGCTVSGDPGVTRDLLEEKFDSKQSLMPCPRLRPLLLDPSWPFPGIALEPRAPRLFLRCEPLLSLERPRLP